MENSESALIEFYRRKAELTALWQNLHAVFMDSTEMKFDEADDVIRQIVTMLVECGYLRGISETNDGVENGKF